MHELSIAAEIYAQSRAAVASHGEGRLENVRVAVGELTAIEPDTLKFAWEAVVAGSSDEGSQLEVEWHPARQSCTVCQIDVARKPGQWLPLCETCNNPLQVEGGQELDLLQVTFAKHEEEEGNDD